MQYSLPIFNADRPFAVLTTWQGQGQLPGGLLGAPNTMPGVLRSEQPIARGKLLGEPGGASQRAAWRARHDAWRITWRAADCAGRVAWRARRGRPAGCLARPARCLAFCLASRQLRGASCLASQERPPGGLLGAPAMFPCSPAGKDAWRARKSHPAGCLARPA